MQLLRDDRVDNVSPPSNDMEDRLAADVDVEGTWDLQQDIPLSDAIEVQSGLRRYFSAMQEKCSLYGFYVPANAGGVFPTALCGLNTNGEQRETWVRLAKAQASVKEFESEMSCFHEANTEAASLGRVVGSPQRELSDARG